MRIVAAMVSLLAVAFAFQDRGPKIADIADYEGTVRVQRGEETLDVGRVARRIRILTGRIVSDVVPSSQVQTDFVTPAGTAAVRGTLVDCGVAGMTAEVGVDDGSCTFH